MFSSKKLNFFAKTSAVNKALKDDKKSDYDTFRSKPFIPVTFETLPIEIIMEEIVPRLSIETLANLSLVSKKMEQISKIPYKANNAEIFCTLKVRVLSNNALAAVQAKRLNQWKAILDEKELTYQHTVNNRKLLACSVGLVASVLASTIYGAIDHKDENPFYYGLCAIGVGFVIGYLLGYPMVRLVEKKQFAEFQKANAKYVDYQNFFKSLNEQIANVLERASQSSEKSNNNLEKHSNDLEDYRIEIRSNTNLANASTLDDLDVHYDDEHRIEINNTNADFSSDDDSENESVPRVRR